MYHKARERLYLLAQKKGTHAARLLPAKSETALLWLVSHLYGPRTPSDEEITSLPDETLDAAVETMLSGFPSWSKPQQAPPRATATEMLRKANDESAKRAAMRAQAQREPPLTPAEKARVATLDPRNRLSFANDPAFRDKFLNRKKKD